MNETQNTKYNYQTQTSKDDSKQKNAILRPIMYCYIRMSKRQIPKENPQNVCDQKSQTDVKREAFSILSLLDF